MLERNACWECCIYSEPSENARRAHHDSEHDSDQCDCNLHWHTLTGFVALGLLRLIGLFTNLFFYQRWSIAFASCSPILIGAGIGAKGLIPNDRNVRARTAHKLHKTVHKLHALSPNHLKFTCSCLCHKLISANGSDVRAVANESRCGSQV